MHSELTQRDIELLSLAFCNLVTMPERQRYELKGGTARLAEISKKLALISEGLEEWKKREEHWCTWNLKDVKTIEPLP